jgi:hypothetical protein
MLCRNIEQMCYIRVWWMEMICIDEAIKSDRSLDFQVQLEIL